MEQITTFLVNKKIACCCKIAQCHRVYKTHVVSSQRDCLASPRQASRQMIRSRMRSSRYVSHLQTQTEQKIKAAAGECLLFMGGKWNTGG